MKTLITLLIGLCIGWVFATFTNPYETTKHKLIDAQRSITYGMSLDSISDKLGSPLYHYKAGEDWHDFTSGSLPQELSKHHSLSVYYIDGFGPQLLLVVSDKESKVVFVSSSYT